MWNPIDISKAQTLIIINVSYQHHYYEIFMTPFQCDLSNDIRYRNTADYFIT